MYLRMTFRIVRNIVGYGKKEILKITEYWEQSYENPAHKNVVLTPKQVKQIHYNMK